jgi:hypothetical protein
MATITELGEGSLAVAVPLLGDAQTALDAAIGVELPSLTANAAAFADVAASVGITPPSAAIFAEAALSFEPPSIEANFALDAGVELNLEIGQLNIYAALALQIAGILATAGVYGYVFQGDATEFTMPVDTAGGGQVFAVVLACQASATPTVTAMQAVFKTTP